MRKIVLIFGIALLAFSCSMIFMASNVRKLEIGMSEQQVTDIMGKDYTIVFADNFTRVLGYINYGTSPQERFRLTFINGKLATIETTIDPPVYQQPNVNVGVGVQIP